MQLKMTQLTCYLATAALVVAPLFGCTTTPETQQQVTDTTASQTETTAPTPSPSDTVPTVQQSAPVVSKNLTPIGQSANKENFEQLLMCLVDSYEAPSAESTQVLESTLAAIQSVSEDDFAVAQSIVSNWQSVFANPNYQLFVYAGGNQAPELAQTGILDSPGHAFVVMGFELVDGEMTEELKARCDAAAAAARTYPNTIIVCSGGTTGLNNPQGHTEAGMMKAYLTETCGIDPARIHIDETSQDTAQNATNTLAILRDRSVQTFTIVTSTYHQTWAQAVYNAAAALSQRDYGVPITIVGNYNVDFPLTEVAPGTEDRWAVDQMASVLGLPREDVQNMLWP